MNFKNRLKKIERTTEMDQRTYHHPVIIIVENHEKEEEALERYRKKYGPPNPRLELMIIQKG